MRGHLGWKNERHSLSCSSSVEDLYGILIESVQSANLEVDCVSLNVDRKVSPFSLCLDTDL